MSKGKFLNHLRAVKKVNQKKAAKDLNVTQPTLSRYENGQITIPQDFFLQALNYYDVDESDYFEYALEHSTEYKYLKEYFESTFEPSEKDIVQFYKYFESNKNSNYFLYLKYIKTKVFFHNVFPDSVPDLTENELTEITQRLINETYYSHQDYDLLGTVSPQMKVEDLNKLIRKMIFILDFKKFRVVASEEKLKFIAVILNNAIDRNISNRNFKEAREMLNALEDYLTYVENSTFQMLVPFYDVLIRCQYELTTEDIEEIISLIKAIHLLGFKELGATLIKEYQAILTGEKLNHFEKSFFFNI